ncbi:Steroid receptor RNA activator-protein/coat protein complex II Sec31 [Penicillium robsamsonii]|uniref:Steroid receptor RNA activator-protein/coat protein complex II Sec31 n=1 Tax=Penicillium robsamsonii TaxID=1792511 RepID=UPI002547BED2|nr:Steroid receptor RNA activator-protein/coat protein complex II Sec31 [Penicillium robsamsonii]KAJ5835909.1 Steroid receptor RNA activator-protein/coat protein complex II Sec31 [Penicillium robsamsonii]
MVRLREIPRTATFAWSPGAASPLIATGTRAGAVDADFSNKTCLELWDLGLDREDASEELQPLAKLDTDSGFNDVAWTTSEDNKRGVIAGGLENGSLELWDADKLLAGSSDALISRTTKHSGAIKTLQFNPKHPNLLATGGAKGELFIWDLNNIENPFRLGNNAARTDDIDCLDWNRKVPHILVTGSSSGFVTVWDVKTKKESLTLNNKGRKAVSAVAWDPERPTKLITSSPLESDPVLYVWDLRNSHAPERTLTGHESGVLSLSWCEHDPDLLLSSGKDNRNICWNPQTGQAYGEFPVVTNWTFQTRWNPHNPNFFATASFDGKICVQTLQNTKTDNAQAIADHNQALDGEDFFNKAQTQPQVSKFSLPKAPRWLERPCGATFGFGGRVVSFGLTEKGSRTSTIKITSFEVDESVGNATESFETALKEGDIRTLCESRASGASNEAEKADWKVMQALISENPRKNLVEYLGFQDQVDDAADSLAQLGLDKKEGENTNGAAAKPAEVKKHKRLQSMFDANPEGDSFLSELAASKGAQTNNPFQIFNGSETQAEQKITRALLLGEFEKALDVALKEDKMSDAFMIAICGGPKCIEKAQEYYFSKQANGPNYMRLLASIVGKNLWDVVHNADLSNWKEVMAALCTFADEKEFPDLCDALGDRLEEEVQNSDDKSARKDASFCFLAGSKLEKVVAIWVEELRENEQKGLESDTDNSSFSIHVRALQGLIEKVTIFRQVTKFQDTERNKDSDWRLSVLYDKYIEYADVVATHGRLDIAQKYLDLVPEKHPEAEVARNRIKLATRQTPQKAQAAVGAKSSFKPLPQQPNMYQPQQSYSPTTTPTPAAPPNMYAPPAPAVTQQANPYGPQATSPAPPANPYAAMSTGGAGAYGPAAGYQPTQGMRPTGYNPPSAFGGQQPTGAGVPPPPRASSTQSPANTITTYTTATGLPAWNDLPEGFAKAPTPRRGTPAAVSAPIASPFPNQSPNMTQGPPPVGAPRAPSVPPPPKMGSVPPPRMMSPLSGGQGVSNIPGPSPPPPANPYASLPQSPPLNQGSTMAPPASIPRGASPYNAPPSIPPPTNRYAPSPAAQAANPQMQPRGSVAPPPRPLPRHTPHKQYHNHPRQTHMGPRRLLLHSLRLWPRASHRHLRDLDLPQPSRRGQLLRLPSIVTPGDRSHIPANAQPVYEILSADMQRVKTRAPAAFKAQVDDAERRLNILFDHLNNEDLLKPNTIEDMANLARAIQQRDFNAALAIHVDIMTNRTDECGNWMVGVKRLISMSRATP